MRRREVISAAPLAAVSAWASRAQDRKARAAREFYEIRRYALQIGDKRVAAHAYLRDALVPALNRAGLEPVGVLDTLLGDVPTVVVIIPHRSLESAVTLPTRLLDDAEHRRIGGPFLDAPSSSPAFVRLETSLLIAFEQMPRLELPDRTRRRVFELRRYESHNELALRTKIEMFNAGEIALFRRIGFRPVFFGETLFGSRMPNLEYLITFDDLATRERLWREFGGDPEWKKMSAIAKYQDNLILSHISATILSSAPYSQI